ncbi:hypothetical protein EUX98_g2367 [Antrodiella citrinella]|uniref:Uncharacterized protein n=1 Tax=Antrodiella citrinella TaxID=2447956 RepID=A0A4V3XJ59_9APHY|nr:hypothetical protein EUX98_g2367 [Antrodiella citrinella]
MIEIPFREVHKQLKEGKATPSFVSNLLSADDYTPDMDYAIKTSAATIYAGGPTLYAHPLFSTSIIS